MGLRERLESLCEGLENSILEVKGQPEVKSNLREYSSQIYSLMEEMDPEDSTSKKDTLERMWEEYILPKLSYEDYEYIRFKYGIRLEDLT